MGQWEYLNTACTMMSTGCVLIFNGVTSGYLAGNKKPRRSGAEGLLRKLFETDAHTDADGFPFLINAKVVGLEVSHAVLDESTH